MKPGTLGEWTGDKWAPVDDDELTRRVNQILASHMAAALADPDLARTAIVEIPLEYDDSLHDAFRAAAKALAGYLLGRVTDTKEQE